MVTPIQAKTLHLDKLVKRQCDTILRTLRMDCVDVEDGTYYLCCLTHDVLKMLYSIIHRNMPVQEAKAAIKVALDDVLINYGLSVQIHEFN
jgi:hypothetical protein